MACWLDDSFIVCNVSRFSKFAQNLLFGDEELKSANDGGRGQDNDNDDGDDDDYADDDDYGDDGGGGMGQDNAASPALLHLSRAKIWALAIFFGASG